MKLTIAVVTMNRAMQLKEALESCLACVLPSETEFVIIDNASSDNTEEIVKESFEKTNYSLYYEKLPENLGVGGGRNYAFSKATGEFFYVLDDDAVIDTSKNDRFFADALEILENNTDIITLTTQIYDTAWKDYRLQASERNKLQEGLYVCKMFCGGSHYLRTSFFDPQPYFNNKYGYEEIPPSLKVFDAKKLNVFACDLQIIHKPAVNKWIFSDEKNHALLINECSVQYAVKKMMYPTVFTPLLWLAYKKRAKKYLSNVPNGMKKSKELVRETVKKNKINYKIKISTVAEMYRRFGLSVF